MRFSPTRRSARILAATDCRSCDGGLDSRRGDRPCLVCVNNRWNRAQQRWRFEARHTLRDTQSEWGAPVDHGAGAEAQRWVYEQRNVRRI